MTIVFVVHEILVVFIMFIWFSFALQIYLPFSFSSQKYCQDILLDFDKSLNSSYFYEDFSVKDTIYPVLTDDIVFKMVVMALICVDRLLQKSKSIIFNMFVC